MATLLLSLFFLFSSASRFGGCCQWSWSSKEESSNRRARPALLFQRWSMSLLGSARLWWRHGWCVECSRWEERTFLQSEGAEFRNRTHILERWLPSACRGTSRVAQAWCKRIQSSPNAWSACSTMSRSYHMLSRGSSPTSPCSWISRRPRRWSSCT